MAAAGADVELDGVIALERHLRVPATWDNETNYRTRPVALSHMASALL